MVIIGAPHQTALIIKRFADIRLTGGSSEFNLVLKTGGSEPPPEEMLIEVFSLQVH